jgi:GTP-binding protein Era
MAAELIRREVILQTGREIPYGVTVLVEAFEELDMDQGREVSIQAVIYCNKKSHKLILVGKGGDRIKAIGTAARGAISALLDAPVHLSLFVKVKPGWENRPSDLLDAGLTGRD